MRYVTCLRVGLRHAGGRQQFQVANGAIYLNKSNTTATRTRSFSTWNWTSNKNDNSSSLSDKGAVDGNLPTSVDAKIQKQVLDKCASLHSSIMPLNEKIRGPLAKNSDKGTSLPFVFLVGNHSSGKSSFINYVMGRNVQTAGVAPTDDCFTVIAPGPEDTDQDGPALIGDPDMGFGNLRQFGPTLIHHTQLKIRSSIQTDSFMMVDSPGMIDSPTSYGGMSSSSSPDSKLMDRGYDFPGVVRWFAERADVVLLFFDPDKPGTTGETLSVLLHSLGGMDHKLLIVLNKADQFKKIHDFARAYGSLCWNLSKVIPRKDLPRIFTMCLPNVTKPEGGGESSPTAAVPSTSSGLADLHQTRDDVVAEVMKAPKRRIDNTITHLNDSVNLLLMHARIVDDVRKRYSQRLWEHRIQEGGSLLTGSALTALSVYTNLPVQFTGGVVAATVLGAGGLRWFNSNKMTQVEEMLTTSEELSASFQRTHPREVSDADEFTASVWQRIREPLRLSLKNVGLSDFESGSKSEVNELHHILDVEIPKLRRMASPSHFGSGSQE
mmetsp:Transcript_1238/g.1950  ORF Transcript_1238/g.1950 Transcript_1238/m.1950 type:complete len:549 (+) Transcript_1238:60-1706(+)|eukprot:CAMPEP_0195284164 /NCGR_PEP_ID=MMETSP0707-20130614/2463_1 /TAXON_ID=33640 /ORGANISM="Asterionellopsis glacialis, Strain CCMP134" /LENGTH=548 /DNA_ID=CAMNT_0040343475 /DNA_START=32 /DNA_END=1678 /DNA_ORIENTATION=+